MTDKSVPFSVLDLAPIPQGSSAKEAFTHSLDLARLAESRGYHRYWLAEHHNMVGIASAATSVLIGYLAANTTTLHLGSGGVMLPNHSPLVIAEQFGTLNTLYPGRIDLGLGRAPGSDQPTMRALRRHMSGDVDNFPRDVAELVDWFDARDPNPHVRPVPGYGERIPVWLLGSSLYSAQLAAQLGCRSRSPRTSRRICCSRPCTCIAATLRPPRGWKNRTRWCASISSPPTATAMRSFSSPPCSRRL
jgi:luciferase family oxidoreductase group 1